MYGLLWQLGMWIIEALAATRHWRFTLSIPLGAAVGFLLFGLTGEPILGIGIGVAICLLGLVWNLNRAAAKEAGF